MTIRNIISALVVTIVAAALNIDENAVTPSAQTTELSYKHQQRGHDPLDHKGLKEIKDIFVPMKNEIGSMFEEKEPEERQNLYLKALYKALYKANTPASDIEMLLSENLIFEEKMMKKLQKMEKRINVLMSMKDTEGFGVSKSTLEKFLRKIESLKKIINE